MTIIVLIISAVLTAASLVFTQLSFLAWFSMIPFIYIMMKASDSKIKLRKAYLYGFIWSLSYYLVIYHWFCYLYPMEFVGATPIEAIGIIAVCWIGLALLQTVGSAFVPLVFRASGIHKNLRPLLFACIWVIFEYLQTLTWAGVPWARIALSQAKFLPAIQSASVFGSLFVSFIIVLINAYLAKAFMIYKENGIKHRLVPIYTLVALAIFSANTLFGIVNLALHTENEGRRFTAGLIQGNIASSDKWDLSAADALELYINMTYEAAKDKELDIVLWPETVINFNLMQYDHHVAAVSKLASDTGAIIFVGTFHDTFTEDTIHEHNAIIAFYPDGSVEEKPYYKQHLVPFGEYLPMSDFIHTFLPMLSGLNMLGSDLTAGDDSRIAQTSLGNIGRLICFDSIYQNLARQSSADGAEVILLSTNDSWYMDSSAVYQHNSHAVLRAVENNRWFIRAANTGISSVISSTGETITYLDPLTQGYIVEDAYMTENRSVYSYIGDIFVIICFAFVVFELTFVLTTKLRKKQRNDP